MTESDVQHQLKEEADASQVSRLEQLTLPLEPLMDPQSDLQPLQQAEAPAVSETLKPSAADGRGSVTILAPGQALPECRPGDFLLVKGVAPLSYLIRFGERLHHSRCAAHWSHAAVVVGQGSIAEALAKGISYSKAAKYDNRWRALVRVVGSPEARANAMRYVEHCIGQDYGFVDFASVALSQLCGLHFIVTTAHAQICSEFVAHSLERLGYIFPDSAELTTPADLYQLFAETGGKKLDCSQVAGGSATLAR